VTSAIIELFLDAIAVDALSLQEQPMAHFVRRSLDGLPVDIVEDAAGTAIGGNCGNLICVPRTLDPTRPVLALFAHLDTPRPTTGVKPVFSDTQITSDGSTILGVDNRLGTSVLLHVLRDHLLSHRPGNFIVVLSVAEEAGMLGAKHLDLSPYNVRMGFVFDCSRRPGTFIGSAVGCSLYTATFLGKPSHAGVSPEKGIHAIRLAARALDRIPMGRLSPTMTSNVGTIKGGTATNVVPESCTVEGEVREFDPAVIGEHLTFLRTTFEAVASEGQGAIRFESAVDFAPFVLDPASPVFRTTEAVMRRLGLTPNPIEYLGGSDANTLNEIGLPSVNLGIGAQNPHGNDEFVLLEDIAMSASIANELIIESTRLS